jgi:hypothetical protein
MSKAKTISEKLLDTAIAGMTEQELRDNLRNSLNGPQMTEAEILVRAKMLDALERLTTAAEFDAFLDLLESDKK